jgi:hypothetical protein
MAGILKVVRAHKDAAATSMPRSSSQPAQLLLILNTPPSSACLPDTPTSSCHSGQTPHFNEATLFNSLLRAFPPDQFSVPPF